MPVLIVGGILAALGIGAAALLVLAAIGVAGASGGLSLWILFPLFTAVGYFMLVAGDRDPGGRAPTTWVAGALLLLALVAAVVLVGDGAGLVAVTWAAPLWYVMVLAGLAGAIGSAAASRATGPRAGQGA
ncbi:MAG: hypothetical protein ABJD97_08565 [Betaproteobacteria bacterium]